MKKIEELNPADGVLMLKEYLVKIMQEMVDLKKRTCKLEKWRLGEETKIRRK